MSVFRPARCLLSRRFAAAARPSAPQYHGQFHSCARLEKRRQRFKNVTAEQMGLMTNEDVAKFSKEKFEPYSKEELEILKKHYTPEQMEALEAGEAAIDPKDLTIQGRFRRDPYKLPYLDDFSRLAPSIDRQPKQHPPPDPNARWMNDDEMVADFFTDPNDYKLRPLLEWANISEEQWEKLSEVEKKNIKSEIALTIKHQQASNVGGTPEEVEGLQYMLERSSFNDADTASNSALAPGLGTDIPGVSGAYTSPTDPEDHGLDDAGIYRQLKRRTGLTVQQIMSLTVKVLVTRVVSNQTRLGKVQSIWTLAIAGNKDGWLGVGEAKSTEPSVASLKAKLLAIRNMQPIRRYENRTIHGSVTAKVSGTVVQLDARPPGFGLRVPARMFELFRACGIHDIAARMPRSRNPMNSMKATALALTNQKDPNEIAIGRGKKLVDVRNVYYGGNVL
ncbi:hypothetical protein BX600DRAFT_506401 [Xylariales sp. PMI_506]|nr:hypothetical protein BX600DRAFT_506401 [Xylariales sp. PMI_506]